MSEMVAKIQSTIEQNAARAAVMLGMSSLAIAGCGGGGTKTVTETTPASVAATPAALTQANNDCGVTPDLSADRANHVYGSPEALFPSLVTQKNGNESLVSVGTAKESIKTQLARDDRVLGVFTAFFIEPRQNKQLPDASTIARADKLIETYKTNKDLATQDLAVACQAVDFLTDTQNFAVTRGQAVEIQADRNKSGQIVNINDATVHSTSSFKGFEVGFNDDDASLSADTKALYQKLQNLILIAGDGTIVINELIGPGSFKVDHNRNVTPVTIHKNGKVIHVKVTPEGKIVPVSHQTGSTSKGGGGTGTSTSTSTGGSSGGGSSVNSPAVKQGHHPEKQSGPNTGTKTGPSGKGNEGAKTGTGQTPNGGGNTPTPTKSTPAPTPTTHETPAPTPTHQTPPPVVTTTHETPPPPPPVTTTHETPPPPPVTTTTTQPTPPPVTPPKGSEPPCVSNPPYVIC